MSKKKALFFDIDGTLVSFNTHKIPQSTIDSLQKAKDAGHLIFISTGRPYSIINNLSELQERNLIDGYITMNGAYTFIGDRVLHKTPIAPDDAAAVAQICDKNGFSYVVMTSKGLSVVNPSPEVKQAFYEFLNVLEIPETTFDNIDHNDIYQITPFFTEDFQKEIASQFSNCEFNRWYPTFVDITAKNITKAIGIKAVADHLALNINDTIAFGDGGNDIPMLTVAGTSVAMGNAADNVKQHADIVTSSVDDNGIENALKMLQIVT